MIRFPPDHKFVWVNTGDTSPTPPKSDQVDVGEGGRGREVITDNHPERNWQWKTRLAVFENFKKGGIQVGLADDIQTLQAQYESDPEKGQELAEALALYVSRKNSKGRIEAGFYELADLLEELGRGDELDTAAGGVDASRLGSWDKQAAVNSWLDEQIAPIPARK